MAILAVACKYKQQPTIPPTNKDTALAAVDTVINYNPYTDADRIRDSLERKHLLDSFYSIKPLAVFKPAGNKEAIDMLVANFIDTTGVVRIPVAFSDTTIYKYNKQQEPIAERQICRSKRYVIEIFDTYEDYTIPNKLFINGRELRAGLEIDTSLSGPFYLHSLTIDADKSCVMKFGAKEYLFISGYVRGCSGLACSVSFYILYDPATRKATLIEEFQSDFFAGYDKKSNSPVFINTANGNNGLFECYFFSGKAYLLDKTNRIKPFIGKDGKQVEYDAYSNDGINSLILTSATFPMN